MSRNPLQTKLISIVEPACNAAGYELVELRFLLEQGGWVLRICIDLPFDPAMDVGTVPEDRVDLTDCENLSRELSAVLDVDDPITQAYSLEVGSPGIDRPLRTAKDFAHFSGSDAKIQMAVGLPQPSGVDRKNFRGILRGLDETGTHMKIEVDGQVFTLAIADIEHAKLVPDWDAVMAGKSGIGAPATKPVKPGHRPSAKKQKKPPKPGPDQGPSTNE